MKRGQRRLRCLTALVFGATAILVLAACTAAPTPSTSSTSATPTRDLATTVAAPGPLHTDGAAIRDSKNQRFILTAASWFGMETTTCAPDGLWKINLGAGMAHIRSMGFNTVRLPYSNECIDGAPVTSVDYTLNPTLKGKTSLQVMDAVVSAAKAAGLRVILDRHRPGSDAQSPLWYTAKYSQQRWIDDWTMLAKRYAKDPTVIGADLHNEPHGTACWGCGQAATDWQAAATNAGNAVLAVNPTLLIIVEGIETESNGTTTWWGGGLADVAAHPISLSVDHRLVYSAHEYGSSIYEQEWFKADDYPSNLPSVWDSHWGFIAKTGIAPVWVGEFGSKLETASDKQWMTALVSYLGTTGISFGYWSFNPNSGDTGGLVKDDWTTPQTAKLAVLKPILDGTSSGDAPGGTSATPAPTTGASSPPSPSSPSLAPDDGAPSGTSGALTASWSLQSSWSAGYVAQVTLKSSSVVSGWTISWRDPTATAVTSAWGMTCGVASGTVTCTGSDWAAVIAAGGTAQVGLQVAGSLAPKSPTLTVTSS